MKSARNGRQDAGDHVAPLAGAWIEMVVRSEMSQLVAVAPLAGAWIEIQPTGFRSEPISVAPLAGAWIEIVPKFQKFAELRRRSPRGSVD